MPKKTLRIECKFYKPSYIAEMMDVSIKTVYTWIQENKIPHVKISGSVRIPSQFLKWVEDRTVYPLHER